MNALNLKLTQYPVRLLAATFAIALASSFAQTAIAQPMGGPGGPGGPGHHGMAGHRGGGGHGMGMMGMEGGPRMMARLLDAVNATPEQRAQIKQLTDAAQADMRSQHDAGRKLHEQNQALFAQPTVDARAAEALRQQMLAQHDQASKRMLQLKLDVSRVLTPEQRKTLADRMAQRRSMMERHRAERDALDKAPR